jgi:diguanylate cyclase (GGDEF)-like protein
MEPPRKTAEEAFRLDTLHSLGLLDTPAEERFDRLCRIARRTLEIPWAMITLVDAERLWIKASCGLELEEIPRDYSFCGHALHDDDILVVSDAAADPRFADNPYVVEDPGIGAYAGCPIAAGNGSRMGTLCVCDSRPRAFSEEDEVLLRDLANIAERELEEPRPGTLDSLTGVSDSRTFYSLARHMLTFCERVQSPATLVFFQLGDADIQSPLHGHAQTDRILMNFADILLSSSRESDVRGRVDTNEFTLLLANCDARRVETVLERVNEALAEYRHMDRPNQSPRVHASAVEYDPARHEDVKTLVDEAGWKLHQNLYPGWQKDKSNIKPVY